MTILAVYEKGVLKPLKKIKLPEHKKVALEILEAEDITVPILLDVASRSKSFHFLKKKKEDIYSLKDGKPL